MEVKRYCNWKGNELWETVKDNPDKPWNWGWLSGNPNITWEIVRDNLDKPWDWYYLSENRSITWEIVRDNLDKAWDWRILSQNPNITWEIIKNNQDKPWDWGWLSGNLFNYNPLVNKESRKKDIKLRLNYFKKIFESTSFFSRNIDKIILKRLNYK